MLCITFKFAAIVISLSSVVTAGLKRPGQDKNAWRPRVEAESENVNYRHYANGRGRVKDNGKPECDGKWKDAEIYGARKKTIKQFCIRLHEKHQDDDGYTKLYNQYDCLLDPNDVGNDHGRKNRDWLCYEQEPSFVLLPPHGPPVNESCVKGNRAWRAVSWYPDNSPPPWCPYNWYAKRQVCWCMPGFYRESPYDTSLNKRGCPEKAIFIVPQFVRRREWIEFQATTTTTTTKTSTTSTSSSTTVATTTTKAASSSVIMSASTTAVAAVRETTPAMLRTTVIARTTTVATTKLAISSTVSASIATSPKCICPSQKPLLPAVFSTTSAILSTLPSSSTSQATTSNSVDNDGVKRDNTFTTTPVVPDVVDCGDNGSWSRVNGSCVCNEGWETAPLQRPCSKKIGGLALSASSESSSGGGGVVLVVILIALIILTVAYFTWRYLRVGNIRMSPYCWKCPTSLSSHSRSRSFAPGRF